MPIAYVGAAASAATAINSLANSPSQSSADQWGQQATDYRQKASDLWNNVATPPFDTTPYSKQTWLQDFTPETYNPSILPQAQMSDSPQARSAILQALSQMQGFAKGGLQPADQIALNQIQQSQAGAASSNAATAADALRARGLGGSGAEYASRLAANQGASNAASSLYDNAMKAAMDRQLNATGQAGAMATGLRNQDTSISKQMADITNQYNSHIMDLQTNAAQNAANVRNAANMANLSGHQTTANNNVAIGNQNLDRNNTLQQQQFGNQTTKVAGQVNALNGQATNASANQAAVNGQIVGANQNVMAGVNGVINSFKNIPGSSSSSPSGSGTSWMDTLTGNGAPTAQTSPNDGQMVDTSTWGMPQ